MAGSTRRATDACCLHAAGVYIESSICSTITVPRVRPSAVCMLLEVKSLVMLLLRSLPAMTNDPVHSLRSTA